MRRTAHSLVRGLASLSPALRLSAPLRAPVAHLAPVRRFVAVPAASSATAAAAPTAVAPAAASAASASIPADATAAAAPVSAATSTPVVKKSSADDEKKKAFRKRFMAPLLYFAISALTLTAGYMFLRHKRYEDKKKEILAAPNAALEPTTLRYIADTYMLSARDLDRIHSILVKDGTAGAVGFDDANDVVFGAVKAHRDARAALFAATAGLREKMEAIVTAERAASKHLIATARAEAEAAAAAEGKGEGAIKAAGDAAEKAAKESTPQFVATAETEALKREARVLVSRTDIPLTEIDDWYGDKDTDERPVRPWDPLVLFRTSRPLSGKNIPITDAMFALAGIMTEFLPPTHPASPAFCPRSILAAPVDTLSKEDLIRRESHLEAVFKHRSRAAKTRRAIDLQPQQRLDMAWRLAADATGADCRPSPPVEGQEEGGVKPPQLPQLSFAEFTAMINAMRRAGHFDLDSLLTTKAWPVRWRAVTPVEISEKYFAAFGKTEKDMISFGEFEAASYKFAEVSEPYLWYLEPDDPSLFGISAAINRHRWRYEASQGRSFVTPPAVPRAHAMAYAASKETARVRAEAFEKIKSLRASAAASSASNAAAAAAAAAVAAPVVAAAPAPVAATPAAGGADAGGK